MHLASHLVQQAHPPLWHFYAKSTSFMALCAKSTSIMAFCAISTSTPSIITNGVICSPSIYQLILIYAWGYGVIFHSFGINILFFMKEIDMLNKMPYYSYKNL
jgi:hypothetical protein